MREAGIGRVLVASLHQGIADLMPSRLEFYENWLNPDGLRQGTIGLAPLKAVLSFLRQEGEPYSRVMAHAGTHAADWLLAARRLPPRAVFRRLPAGLRTRVALGTARRLVRACYWGNGVAVRVRGGLGVLEIRDSVFCVVREPAAVSLCGFYAALAARVFEAYGMPCELRTAACRATGASACELVVSTGPQAATPAGQSGSEVVR
jgi:bacteriochlorophyll 4-vinyl reductase